MEARVLELIKFRIEYNPFRVLDINDSTPYTLDKITNGGKRIHLKEFVVFYIEDCFKDYDYEKMRAKFPEWYC